MFEYAFSFYQNYLPFFFILTIIAVLLEWPIVILTLTLLSGKLGIPISLIIILSLIGDFGGDMLHFYLGKYGNTLLKKLNFKRKSEKLTRLNKKIKNYPLLEKLIIIKYTPPITSIGLIYLGTTQLPTLEFIKTTLPLCLLSSWLIISIGYFFGEIFTKTQYLWVFFFGAGIVIFSVIILLKFLGKFLVRKIKEKHHQKSDF